jgi:hypothetical protein
MGLIVVAFKLDPLGLFWIANEREDELYGISGHDSSK